MAKLRYVKKRTEEIEGMFLFATMVFSSFTELLLKTFSMSCLFTGGFAIDHGGVVRWKKVAENAVDTCDYEEAVKKIMS
jgi:hypothetical protein